MLLAVLIHAEALEVNVPSRPELRLHGAGDVDWRGGAELRHAGFHDAEFERDYAGHFDGAAETWGGGGD